MRTFLVTILGLTSFTLATPAPVRAPPSPPPRSATTEPSVSVVGGTLAAKGEFPWVVNVDGCGGTLYARQIVLTAGHCVRATGPVTNITTTLGVVDLEDRAAVKINSTYVYNNDPSVPLGVLADWALVKLATPAPDWIPTIPITTDETYNNGMFTVAGWGDTKNDTDNRSLLRKAEVPFVDSVTCAKAYPPKPPNNTDPNYFAFKPSLEICAAFPQGGVDTCQGDSGGPMFRVIRITPGSRWASLAGARAVPSLANQASTPR